VLAKELHNVRTNYGPHGEATQDPSEWWRIIKEVSQRLLSDSTVRASDIVAVAITGQWSSTVPVDANGAPTWPCIMWMDSRGAKYSRRFIGGPAQGYRPLRVLKWIQHTGGAPSLSGADPIGHFLYLQSQEPALVKRTRWFLEPVDFLTMQFTGTANASHASMQGAWLTDTRHLSTYSYDKSLVRLLGIDEEKLAPLRPIGSILGVVQPSVARELGLNADVAVITGLPDLQAAALGAGTTSMYQTHLALSTTSWISCPVPKKKTDIAHSVATVPGLTNDSYLLVNNQETGAKALDWVRTVLLGSEALSYDDLCAMAEKSPAGSNGVVFTPWLAGERSPIDMHSARAGFSNLQLATTANDLVRSVLEGVAYNSRWLLHYVERFTKQPLEPIRLVGGGAQSPLWCQIYADVLNRTIEQVPDPMYAQLRGMAVLAGVALGERTLGEINNVLPSARQFDPNPAVTDRYDQLAAQVPTIFKNSRQHWRSLRSW
jgi:xylulokinase